MKILILNACHNQNIENLNVLLPNKSNIIHIRLQEQNILHCTGCMSCVWNMESMNPGYCILKDDMNFIYPTFIHSDLVILMTDIVFGGFSHQMKKIIDRLISALFTAPLKKRGLDVGHIMRYKKRPSIYAIGFQNKYNNETADTFTKYIENICTLWDVPYGNSLIYALDQDAESNNQLIQNTITEWKDTLA